MADRLQKAGIPELFGAREVLVWEDGPLLRFAFRGDALRIQTVTEVERRDGSQGMLENKHHRLDTYIQRAAGYDARTERRSYGYEIVGGLGQTLEEPDDHFAQVLEAIARIVGEQLDRGEDVKVTLMPKQGKPWSPKESPTAHYNAKTRRSSKTTRPEWLVEVLVRKEDLNYHGGGPSDRLQVVGADICRLAPIITHTTMRPFVSLGGGADFLVSHSFDPTPYAGDDPRPWATRSGKLEPRESAELVKRCGGWIYPSVGVSKFASTTFGPVTLLAGADLVLDGLSPRRPRGQRPVSLFEDVPGGRGRGARKPDVALSLPIATSSSTPLR